MREIKLRAWNPETKQMAYFEPFYHVYNCEANTVLEALKISEGSYLEGGKYGEEVLMQYTGLKDKNDVEIYEGDIVRYYADGLPEDEQKAVLTNGPFASYPVSVEVLPWESKFSDSEHDDFHEMIDKVVYSGCSFSVTPVNGTGEGSLWRASEHCEIIGNIYENPDLLK